MMYPESQFPDISSFPMGSRQEMGYYRSWLKRYEGLHRHEAELDKKLLVGWDLEVLNCHAEIESLVDADRSAEGIAFTIYGKWMKPSTRIAPRLNMAHPEVAKFFDAIAEHIKGSGVRHWSLYREAIDAFVKTTLKHFCDSAPECIDLDSFRKLKDSMHSLGSVIAKGGDAVGALKVARERYLAFVGDLETCEREDVPVFYELYDGDERESLDEIMGNVKCSNDDLEKLDDDLRAFTVGADLLRYFIDMGMGFSDRINPRGTAMYYTLLGLQWYHMWALSMGPGELIDDLGHNRMMLEGVVDRIGMLFTAAKKACYKTNQAIEAYTNYVQDAEKFSADKSVSELNRQNKLESVLGCFDEIAFVIKEEEDRMKKTYIATGVRRVEGGWAEMFMNPDSDEVYDDLMDEVEHHEMVQREAREQSAIDENEARRHLEAMKEKKAQTELLEKLVEQTSPEEHAKRVLREAEELHNSCNMFQFAWTKEQQDRYDFLEKKLSGMPDEGPETMIVLIARNALDYYRCLIVWHSYLRGESDIRPQDFKGGDGKTYNVGTWMVATFLPCLVEPMKVLVRKLPMLNSAEKKYPRNDIEETFKVLGVLLALMNHCEEELKSEEGSSFGVAYMALQRLHQLLTPPEIRPGHVVLEGKLIAKAFADWYVAMSIAAHAMVDKVKKRDDGEIDISEEMAKIEELRIKDGGREKNINAAECVADAVRAVHEIIEKFQSSDKDRYSHVSPEDSRVARLLFALSEPVVCSKDVQDPAALVAPVSKSVQVLFAILDSEFPNVKESSRLQRAFKRLFSRIRHIKHPVKSAAAMGFDKVSISEVLAEVRKSLGQLSDYIKARDKPLTSRGNKKRKAPHQRRGRKITADQEHQVAMGLKALKGKACEAAAKKALEVEQAKIGAGLSTDGYCAHSKNPIKALAKRIELRHAEAKASKGKKG